MAWEGPGAPCFTVFVANTVLSAPWGIILLADVDTEVPITAGGPEIRWDLAKGAVVWGKTPGWMDGVRTTGACRATGTTASSSLQGARVSSFSKDWEMDEVELTSSKSS